MSPEVAEHKPYNQATDVYSFGIVLYEILTLTRPKRKDNSQCVNPSKLKLGDECPQLVNQAMQSSFSSVLENRPTMEEFWSTLNLAIAELESSSSQSKSPIRQSQLGG
jgi:serine/threonine-protein kinase CTR1